MFIILYFLPSYCPSCWYTFCFDLVFMSLFEDVFRQCKYNITLRRVRATIFCRGKEIRITYSECVYLALIIQHAMCLLHIVICGLSGCTIFFHFISKTARFSEKSYWVLNVCFDFLYKFCLKHFSFWEEMSEIW